MCEWCEGEDRQVGKCGKRMGHRGVAVVYCNNRGGLIAFTAPPLAINWCLYWLFSAISVRARVGTMWPSLLVMGAARAPPLPPRRSGFLL